MEKIVLGVGFSLFLLINLRILYHDIQERRIPNTLLGYLLILILFFYIYNFFVTKTYIDISSILISCITILGVGFGIFYFKLWGAGDAKYLMVLGLCIPHIHISVFIFNIILVTLVYGVIYFLYFYFIQFTKYKIQENILVLSLKEKRDTLQILSKKKNNIFLFLSEIVLVFITVYALIRVGKVYIFTPYIENIFPKMVYIETLSSYISLISIFLFIGIILCIRYMMKHLFFILEKKHVWNDTIKITSLCVFLWFILIFIVQEYLISPFQTQETLFLIFTLYLGIFLFLKMLYFLFQVVYSKGEIIHTKIRDLKIGMFLDKESIKKDFTGRKKVLVYFGLNMKDRSLDASSLKILKKCIRCINKAKKRNGSKNYIEHVGVLKTIAFSIFIFLGFCISIFLGSTPLKKTVDIIISILSK